MNIRKKKKKRPRQKFREKKNTIFEKSQKISNICFFFLRTYDHLGDAQHTLPGGGNEVPSHLDLEGLPIFVQQVRNNFFPIVIQPLGRNSGRVRIIFAYDRAHGIRGLTVGRRTFLRVDVPYTHDISGWIWARGWKKKSRAYRLPCSRGIAGWMMANWLVVSTISNSTHWKKKLIGAREHQNHTWGTLNPVTVSMITWTQKIKTLTPVKVTNRFCIVVGIMLDMLVVDRTRCGHAIEIKQKWCDRRESVEAVPIRRIRTYPVEGLRHSLHRNVDPKFYQNLRITPGYLYPVSVVLSSDRKNVEGKGVRHIVGSIGSQPW